MKHVRVFIVSKLNAPTGVVRGGNRMYIQYGVSANKLPPLLHPRGRNILSVSLGGKTSFVN